MAPRQVIDISMRVSPRLAVFPGDTPLTREVLLDQRDGATVTLSTKRMTVHMGTHADAPLHYVVGGAPIDRQPLELYWGICDVVHVRDPLRARGGRIGWDDIVWKGPTTPRVLIGTGTFEDPERWTEDFAGLEPDLIDRMADMGVRLVGVDTPSVDTATSKDLPTHARCAARGVSIIEGLRLDGVLPGQWELVALPLALEGFDASPIRAALRALRDEGV
jgi:arylformamidase